MVIKKEITLVDLEENWTYEDFETVHDDCGLSFPIRAGRLLDAFVVEVER